jgi:MFS family permease
MGWVLGSFWLAYALFEIPVGWWGDRFGSRRTLARIVLGWSVFTALSGTATGFLSLLAARFLFGVERPAPTPTWRASSRAGSPCVLARAPGACSGSWRGGAARSRRSFSARCSARSPSWEAATGVHAWRSVSGSPACSGWRGCALFFRWFRDEPRDKPTVNEAELDLIESGRGPVATSHATPPGLWAALFTTPSLWRLQCSTSAAASAGRSS